MPFFDAIRKHMGMPAVAEKGTWPRRVRNNELPPERIPVRDDYEPATMSRHGFGELKVNKRGQVVLPQPPKRLPHPSRFIRDADQHNDFLRDGASPPPGGDDE
jgi:hypothetical protein